VLGKIKNRQVGGKILPDTQILVLGKLLPSKLYEFLF